MKLTKTLLVAPLAAAIFAGSAFAADVPSSDDLGYSVGYTMGKTLQQQMKNTNISTDNEELASGLEAGINGKDSKLSEKEMQQAMLSFQQQAMEAQKDAKGE